MQFVRLTAIIMFHDIGEIGPNQRITTQFWPRA